MPSPSSISRIEALLLLDDRHLGAEPPVHLREFKTDIAAADDDQMLGEPVESEHRGVGQIRRLVDAGEGGHGGASANIDEDSRRGQSFLADGHRIRRHKTRVTADDRATLHAAEPIFDPGASFRGNGIRPRLHACHVDAGWRIQHDPVIGGAPGEVGGIGAGDERLGRHAAGVDAGTAK